MDNYLDIQDKRLSSHSVEAIVRLLQGEMAEVLSFAASVARRTGLGLSEMIALEHLQRAGGEGLTPTQLGRRLSMSSGTITALVDRLERAGYAERRPNPADRRSSVVHVRPAGLEEAARHMRALAGDLLAATAGFGETERATVGAYLGSVTEVIARHARGEHGS